MAENATPKSLPTSVLQKNSFTARLCELGSTIFRCDSWLRFQRRSGISFSNVEVFFTYGSVFLLPAGLCGLRSIRFGHFSNGWNSIWSCFLIVENWFVFCWLKVAADRKLGLVFSAYGSPTGSKKTNRKSEALNSSESSKPVQIRTYLHETPQKTMYKFAPPRPRL